MKLSDDEIRKEKMVRVKAEEEEKRAEGKGRPRGIRDL